MQASGDRHVRLQQPQPTSGTKISNKPCLCTACNGDEGLCSTRRGQPSEVLQQRVARMPRTRARRKQGAGSGCWMRKLYLNAAFYAELTYPSSTKVDFTPAVVSALLAGTDVVYTTGGPRHYPARLCPIQPKRKTNRSRQNM